MRASEYCDDYAELTFSVGAYTLFLGIDSKPPESWFDAPLDGVVVVESVEDVDADGTTPWELFIRGRVETPLGTEQVSGHAATESAVELSCV